MAILAVFVFFVAHIPKMKIITSFESFFVEDDEAIRTYDEFKKEFGNDKTVYVLVEPREGELFTLENMKVLQNITTDLEKNIRDPENKNIRSLNFMKLARLFLIPNSRAMSEKRP